MIRRVCLVALLGLASALSACKPRQERGSELRDLNQGTPMNGNQDPTAAMRESEQKVVVIYYANDTYAVRGDDPARLNMDALAQALNEAAQTEAAAGNAAEEQRMRGIAEKLETEWERFRDTVSEDVGVLSKRLCQTVVPSYQKSIAGFVVFRNFTNDDTINPGDDFASRAVRRLKFTVCKPDNSTKSEGYSFEVPRMNEFPYLSQPLSHPLVFQKALEAVRGIFPAEKNRYILITKSHGSEEVAVAPNLSVDLTDTLAKAEGRKAIINAVKSHKSIGGLDPMKQGTDPILADMDETLREAKSAPTTVGVTKGDYIQILRDLGTGDKKQVMNFPIVLMESCRSDLRYSKDEDLKWVLTQMGGNADLSSASPGEAEAKPSYSAFNMMNVGYVYTSDRQGLGYKAVRYSDLNMSRFQMNPDFQDAFKSFLDSMAKK